jgi:trans-aconitate methyltransferase
MQHWDGYSYHTYAQIDAIIPIQLLSQLDLPSYRTILDFGCGAGNITAWIAQHATNSRVIGLDPSPSMINFARTHYRDVPNVSFHLGDADNLHLTERASIRYDLIVSSNVFHWIWPQENVLTILARVAQPGAKLLIVMGATPSQPSAFQTAVSTVISQPRWQELGELNWGASQRPHNPTTFRQLLDQAGFIPTDVTILDQIDTFPSLSELTDYIGSFLGGFPPIGLLSREDQSRFREDLVRAYVEAMGISTNGVLRWSSPRLIAWAQKPWSLPELIDHN